MAETSQDEREREGADQGQEPDTSREERQEPEADASREERQEREAGDDEREREPVDLPEPKEKSADDLLGQQVVDPHGYTIGKIEALFTHGQDERASWAQVKTGLVRTSSVFMPIRDAQEDGDQIRVVYEKEHVNAAPEIEPEGNELNDDEADVLHAHYGLERVKGLTKETAEEGDMELPRETRDATPPTMKEPPWAVEKYPLPDMERPEEGESSRSEGEEPSRADSSGEDSSDQQSGAETEDRAG